MLWGWKRPPTELIIISQSMPRVNFRIDRSLFSDVAMWKIDKG